MQLLNEEVRNQIKEIFNKDVPNPVKVVLFTRAFNCETCEYAERLLKEIEETVPEKFKVEVVSTATPEGQEKAKGVRDQDYAATLRSKEQQYGPATEARSS